MYAFISSRLDYCNSLLVGVSEDVLRKLQLIQNAAARLVTGTRKFDHISPVLRDLHWLPIRKRITYKVAMLVYKCLHGLAPNRAIVSVGFLPTCFNCLRLTTPAVHCIGRFVRSSYQDFGCWLRSFSVSGPVTWNSLPTELRLLELSVVSFANRLKSYLFNLPL